VIYCKLMKSVQVYRCSVPWWTDAAHL